jgi:hypothetical protein
VLTTTDYSEIGVIRLGDHPILNEVPAADPVLLAVAPDSQVLAATHSHFDFDLPQPNFIWVMRGLSAGRVLFSASSAPVFSDHTLAVASVPSGCAGLLQTPTPSATLLPPATPSRTAPPTSTPTPATCPGDCNGDGAVTVDELIQGVQIALGNAPVTRCPAFDINVDGVVTIDELVIAVNDVLTACPAQ